MNLKARYVIDITLLGQGLHHFSYTLDAAYVKEMLADEEDLSGGTAEIQLELDRQEHLAILAFHLKGTVIGACDRCLADVTMPIELHHTIYARSVRMVMDEDQDDVIDLEEGQHQLVLDDVLRDLYLLAVPIRHVCVEGNDSECDKKMLEALSSENEREEDEGGHDFWSEIKRAIEE